MKKETLEKGLLLMDKIKRLKKLLTDPISDPWNGFTLELNLRDNRFKSNLSEDLSEDVITQSKVIKQELYQLIRYDFMAQLAALEKEFAELSDETMTDNQ